MNKILNYKARKAVLLSALFFVAIAIASSGCNKDSNDLSPTLVPEEDTLAVFQTDTFTLNASAYVDDSIYSGNAAWLLLGEYHDPKFGIFKAGFAAQLRLTSSNLDFPDGSTCTGVDMTLVYNDAHSYGSFSSNGAAVQDQTFEVFRVTEPMTAKLEYETTDMLQNDGDNKILAGAETFKLNPSNLDAETGKPTLTIALDPTFGQVILNEDGSANLTDNDNFVSFFNGIVVQPNNASQAAGEGAVAAFDLVDAASKVSIYYTHSGGNDTLDLVFNSSSARYTFVEQDYSGSDAEVKLNNPEQGQQEIFVQGAAGIAFDIEIPYLEKLATRTNFILNRAELILPVSSDVVNYPPPSLLQGVEKVSNEGIYQPILDYNEGSLHYEGTFDDDEKQYVINITRFAQQVLEGSRSNALFQINASGSGIQYEFSTGLQKSGLVPQRAILNGPESASDPAKVVIYYTKY